MALPVVRLLADGGDITVGRRVSTFIYGVMNVTLADGVVGEEPEKTGLEEGYIVRADGDVPTGRFDFGFTRHDASMHMGLHTSDMEQGIVAASRRVEGGVFFERDIEPGGFGRWVPGVDFRVGDVVGVVRWGRVIPLPVTALNLRDGRWVAHVGGQMIHDAEKLRSQNQSIEKTIADERRQRAKDNKDQSRRIDAESDARRRAVADVDAKAVAAGDAAKAADSKAVAAQATADDADGKAKKLAEALSGGGATIPTVMADLQRLNKQLQQNGEGGAADQGLIPAYIAANTKRWELQEKVDKQQDYVSALLSWQIRTLQESVAWSQEHAPYGFALPGFDKTVVKPFLRVEVGDASGLSPNTARLVNTSSDVRLRVSYSYWRTPQNIVSAPHASTGEDTVEPGRSYVISDSGAQVGSFLFIVTPEPLRPFEPSLPPVQPRD